MRMPPWHDSRWVFQEEYGIPEMSLPDAKAKLSLALASGKDVSANLELYILW